MDFSEKIKALRKEAGLSQTEFGNRFGVTNRAVSKWENAQAMPSTEKLLDICSAFGISTESLFADKPKATERPKPEGMESLRELYKIGKGPSSSHTMGPERAAKLFLQEYPEADSFKAILMGSLAKTGRGHRTDYIITETFKPHPCEIAFDVVSETPYHPNTMRLYAYRDGKQLGSWEVYSVGGGSIEIQGRESLAPETVYPHSSFAEIGDYCRDREIRLWQYVDEFEGPEIWDYLANIWQAMQSAIRDGLKQEGILYGGLNVQRRAKHLLEQRHIDENAETRENRLVCAYAFAVSEQNAACGTIVTAPTCGSCGILPAVLKYVKDKRGFAEEEILHGIAVAGLIGNIIKTNASISGAECGCQAEVGSACAMAAAAIGEIYEMSISQIEYAAEVAIEHHLGLTCDPILGLVQIPCIERNAVAAMRAINAINLANFLTDSRKISFDAVVATMYETGKDLSHRYRETSEGGLAKLYMQ